MFVDEVHVTLTAGKWGDGNASLRREANIPKWGPWWGNGGKWGDIILQANPNHNTLSTFRYKKIFRAKNGENGGQNNMTGACAPDLILPVPVGTLVRCDGEFLLNTTDTNLHPKQWEIIHDLSEPYQSLRLCQWGRGGYGNANFTSSTRQKPTFAELGDRGESMQVTLELKLVADIGIIGLPSAGKSTLISCLTNAKPKIAQYHFTTLVPNLGIMEHKGKSLVLEDVPGLIPGAHKWDGLGIQFLKHIQRTKTLLHLLDASEAESCLQNYQNIRNELELFDPDMMEKEEIIVISKIDLISEHDKETLLEMLNESFPDKKIFTISAPIAVGLEDLKNYLIQNFAHETQTEVSEEQENVIDLRKKSDPNRFIIEDMWDYQYRLVSDRIGQIVRMSDPNHPEATARIYDVLQKRNVIHELEKLAKATFEAENPRHELEPSEVWYHIGTDANILIEWR